MPLLIEDVPSNIIATKFQKYSYSIQELVDILSLDTSYEEPTITRFGVVASGQSKYNGGVLAPNGKIYAAPAWSGSVLVIDPITKNLQTVSILSNASDARWCGAVIDKNGMMHGILSGSSSQMEFNTNNHTNYFRNIFTGDNKFYGGVIKNNKIYSIPYSYTKVLEFDIETKILTTFGNLSGLIKWTGGVLHPNGKIYGTPFNSPSILEINPEERTTRLIGSFTGTEKWIGAVLGPNNKIYFIPNSHTQILEFNPETEETILFGSLPGTNKWQCGVLAPNGRIYGIPKNSTGVLEIDPITHETQIIGDLGTATYKYHGGILAPNGKIYGMPQNSTTVLEIDTHRIPRNPTVCHHQYFNKL